MVNPEHSMQRKTTRFSEAQSVLGEPQSAHTSFLGTFLKISRGLSSSIRHQYRNIKMYHTKQLSFDNTLDKLGPKNLQHINEEYPKLQDTGTMSNKCEQ